MPVNIDEGEGLLAKLTPGDWGFDQGAVNNSHDCGPQPKLVAAWIPSYGLDDEDQEQAEEDDGIAIAWLMKHGKTMLAELRDLRVAGVKLSGAADDYRDAVNEFCDDCCERKVRQFMGAESSLLAARDELDRLIPITQARDAGEGWEHG